MNGHMTVLHLWTLLILLKGLKHSRCQGKPHRWLVAQVVNTDNREGTEDWGRARDKETERKRQRAGSLWQCVEQLQRGMRPLSPHSPHKICTICSSGCAIQFWQRPLCIIFWGKMVVIIIKCSHPGWVCRAPLSPPACWEQLDEGERGGGGMRGPWMYGH